MSDKLGGTELYWEDAAVIAVYFLMVFAVGAWSSWRSKRDSVNGYFLASRSMHWIPVGASLFASNIGSGHFIGLSGSGASSGIGIAGFELNAMFVVLILGWFFVPVYMASGVYTMPEYLRKRFGGQRIRIYLSVLALLLYVFTKISADLYAGGIFINQAIKLDLYGSVLSLLAVAGIFTMAGGLSAVIWTDFAQTILMLVGASALAILSITRVGGYSQLVSAFPSALPSNLSSPGGNCSPAGPPENYMSLLRSPEDPEMPWTGMIIGLTINAVWYWCSDQVIVQRALSARDLSHAKGGCVLAGYLKLLPLPLIVLPGMAARILFPDEVACSVPMKCKEVCGSEIGCTNIAYPKLVLELMPRGARGLMMSVMLAALLSSLTSIFNSASTLFTMDIWRRIRRQATETELLIVGRLFVLVLVGVGVAWIPVVQSASNSQLFHYIQSVTAFLAPPVTAVYLLALTCRRVNEQGAFWGLMCGLVIGLSRFAWEFSYPVEGGACGHPDPRPALIARVHYLHFGIILFVVSCAVTLAVSYCTQPIHEKHLHRLLFWNRHSREARVDITKKVPAVDKGVVNAAFREDNHNDLENPVKKFRQFADEVQPAANEGPAAPLPKWRRALYLVCGVSSSSSPGDEAQFSAEDDPETAAQGIVERPLWRDVCNANAILLMVVGAFVWGYYA